MKGEWEYGTRVGFGASEYGYSDCGCRRVLVSVWVHLLCISGVDMLLCQLTMGAATNSIDSLRSYHNT